MDTLYTSPTLNPVARDLDAPVPAAETRDLGTPIPAASAKDLWAGYSPKSVGPKYPPHNMDAPIFGGIDAVGLLAATIMALGPLSAYAAGFGL